MWEHLKEQKVKAEQELEEKRKVAHAKLAAKEL